MYSRALAVYIDIWYSKYHLPPLGIAEIVTKFRRRNKICYVLKLKLNTRTMISNLFSAVKKMKLILYYRRLCIEDEEYTFDLPIFIKPRWGRRKRLKSWRRMSRKKA